MRTLLTMLRYTVILSCNRDGNMNLVEILSLSNNGGAVEKRRFRTTDCTYNEHAIYKCRTFNKILTLVDINYYNYGTLTLKFIKILC